MKECFQTKNTNIKVGIIIKRKIENFFTDLTKSLITYYRDYYQARNVTNQQVFSFEI